MKKLVVVEEHVAKRITCGSFVAKRQQDHFGSPMAAGACGVAAGEERAGRRRGEDKRDLLYWQAGPQTGSNNRRKWGRVRRDLGDDLRGEMGRDLP